MDLTQIRPEEIERVNREHFDKVAADGTYDNHPFVEQVSRQIAQTIRDVYPFDEQSTLLLDYACGTGQISRNLAPYTKKIVGVDISQGMVDYYNQRVYNQGISQDEMKAFCVQLTGADTDLDGQKFDIIVCAQAYHHFPDILPVTNILASLLKPGTGKLFVADLMTYDPSILKQSSTHSPLPHQQALGHSHSHSHLSTHEPSSYSYSHSHSHPNSQEEPHAPFQGPTVVRKGGFEESELQSVFTAAGLVDWQFIKGAASVQMKDKHLELFLAIGRRPE